jgi:toxin ParE1/3/4
MVYRVIFSLRAQAQLVHLHRYISEASSPAIGEIYTTAIAEYCQGLTTFPHRGATRDDVRPGLRVIGFRRRVTIAFTVDGDAVKILGVFYGGQDYESALRDDDEAENG